MIAIRQDREIPAQDRSILGQDSSIPKQGGAITGQGGYGGKRFEEIIPFNNENVSLSCFVILPRNDVVGLNLQPNEVHDTKRPFSHQAVKLVVWFYSWWNLAANNHPSPTHTAS